PKPAETPNTHGSPRTMPKLAPSAVSITLFGPGVIEVTRANRLKERVCSTVKAGGAGSELRVSQCAGCRSAGHPILAPQVLRRRFGRREWGCNGPPMREAPAPAGGSRDGDREAVLAYA